jgi:ATP-dependent Clp protease ATP-binding subunit ClpB
VLQQLRSHFRPEFLNRIDEIVLFKPLLVEQVMRIVDLQMQRLQARLEERQIQVQLTEAARQWIAREAYDPVYGARPLLRFLQAHVETPLARQIIAGTLRDGQTVTVDVDGDQLAFRAD